jgi:hypothetical protein
MPLHADAAFIGLCRSGNHLQQGAFAGTVDANDSYRFTWLYLEADLSEHPVQVMPDRSSRDDPFG